MNSEKSKAVLCNEIINNSIGSDEIVIWNRIFPRFACTNALKELAEVAGAYWLLDAIASHVICSVPRLKNVCPELHCRMFELSFWDLHKFQDEAHGWVLMGHDGNIKTDPDNKASPELGPVHQRIDVLDFPLQNGFTVYCARTHFNDRNGWVLMLPSEY